MKLFKILKQSEYFNNISIQLIGIIIAQLIPILVSPILSRIYFESSFATLTLFSAVLGVFAVPIGGRYYLAIILPKSEGEAKALTSLSLYLTFVYVIALYGFIFVFYNILNENFRLNELWYLIPLHVFFIGVYNIYLYYSIRLKKFKVNAIAKIAQTLSNSILNIVFWFLGLLFSGLVYGKLLGLIISIPFIKRKTTFKTGIAEIKKAAKKYVSYPKLTIVPAFLDIFSLQALVFFVGKYYSEQTLGYLGLTNIILVAPLALVGVSFRDVFFQKAAFFFQEKKYKKTRSLFLSSALFLFLIGILIALVLFFYGTTLFTFIYGEKWKVSGVFAAILGFSLCMKLVVSPLSVIFNVTNQLKSSSTWQVIYFITTLTTLYISIVNYQFSIKKTLIVYTIHEIILYLFYFMLELKTLINIKYNHECVE